MPFLRGSTRGAPTLIVPFAFLAIVACARLGPAEEPEPPAPHPRLGKWRLNLEESIPPQGATFRPYVVEVLRADDVLEFEYTATGPDGRRHSFGSSSIADGVVRDLPGSGDTAGLRGAMIRLPNGSYEARLWAPDGSYENKFCQVMKGFEKQVCLATVTHADGHVTFFKQVLDRVKDE
ncbi:MAG: hypothetical protein NXI30_12940 [bacterium]|nr:hypothetical protein [bacterium]